MKTSDIKLKWQRHNQKNGMSWNEMSEFANEIADHVLSEKMPEKLKEAFNAGKVAGFYEGLDAEECIEDLGYYTFEEWYTRCLTQPQVKCECIECGGLFMSDVHQDYCKGCER